MAGVLTTARTKPIAPAPQPGQPAASPGPVAAGATATTAMDPDGGRGLLHRLAERHPTVVDTLVMVLLLAPVAATGLHGRHPQPEQAVIGAALVIPLAWRRRAPRAVFAVQAFVALGQWLFTGAGPGDVSLLLGLYSVAAHRSRRWALAAYAVLELGVLMAVLRWTPLDTEAMIKAFVALSGMATAALVLGFNTRARRAQLVALQDRAVQLERQRDQQSALAVAEERARIAREMHDIVTHNLSVMVALADGAVYANAHSPERATAAMRQAGETGRQALTDMRRFLDVLRADEPDALRHPQPGIAQLEALATQVRAAGLPVDLEVAGETAAVPQAAQLTAYRLVQEALTNTLKHTAPGARAQVRIRCAGDRLELDVRDDGRPVRTAPKDGDRDPARPGQGLAGMRERVAVYGGRLAAGPLPEGGWRVSAVLELAPAAGAEECREPEPQP